MRKSLEAKWCLGLVLAALGVTSASAACTYSLAPGDRNHGNNAATNSFVVNAATGCDWTVVNTNAWISLLSGASGTGTGTVTYAVSAQVDSVARGGFLAVSGQVFHVTQDGIPCNYAVSPVSRNHGAAGAGPGNPPNPIQVSAATNCVWTATTTNSWITFPGSFSGVSTGSVPYYVAANWTPVWRTGVVNIANRTTTISQNPASCLYELSPTNRLHGFAGSTGVVQVLTIPPSSGCTWFVNNTNPWITITVNGSGTNSGTFGYSVAPNPNSAARSGSFNVWDQFFTVFQNATPCSNAVIAPTSAAPDAEAQTNSVSVVPVGGCPDWVVVNTNAWISVSPLSGAGNGTVSWSVALNSGATGRTGVVRIAEQNFTVRQAGAVCDYKLSTTNRQHGYSATTNSVQLTVLSICPWSVENTNAWITMLTATNGSGSFSNAYALLQNSSAIERTGLVVIAGQVLTIRQLGANCAISLSPTNRSHGHGAATNSVVVNTAPGCVWDAVNTNGWISLQGATSGAGSNLLTYVVAANPSSVPRVGVITVNESSTVITQNGAPCTPDLVPNSELHTAAAEVGNVALSLPIGCAWSVVNTNPWVVSVSPASGSGGTNISYVLATNLNGNARTGTLLIAGLPYLITQEGVACAYRLSPTNRAHGFGTASNIVTMIVSNPCPWTVFTTNSWISFTSATNGAGSNTVSYLVAANPSAQERIGAIFGEGSLTVITQRGVTCGYSLSPGGRNHGFSATNGTIGLTAPGACAWTVVNTNPWVTITSATNGSGNATVAYSITSHTGLVTRAGNIAIADQLFALSQSPASCNYKLSPTNRAHGFGATTNSVAITAGAACAWNIATTNTWITFLTPTSGTGNSNVTYTISANFGNDARVGHITLVDEVLVLTQAAPTNGFVFESVTVSPSGDLNVRLGGGPAGIWELQSSTNLSNWTKIADLTNITGRVDYHAPPPLAPMKYLRAVLP